MSINIAVIQNSNSLKQPILKLSFVPRPIVLSQRYDVYFKRSTNADSCGRDVCLSLCAQLCMFEMENIYSKKYLK